MPSRIVRLLPLSLVLSAPVALAQSPTPGAPPVEAATTAPLAATAGTANPAEAEAAAKLSALEKRVAELEKANQAQEAALAKAAKLKISGYVQGRYEWHQDATNGATFDPEKNYAATPTNTDRFLLRHAYFTAAYNGTHAEYFFQIDGSTNDGVMVKDAYAALVDTWTPLKMKLSAGQFRYTFGYEAQQSDADREMPERAPIEKFFFDGERDRGLRLQGGYQFFNFAVALVNGTIFDGKKNLSASKDPGSPYPFGKQDPNEFKDWVGRLGVDFGYLAGGLSGYFGKGLYIAPATAAKAETPDSRYKYRLGADVQGYVDIPSVGNLTLKGEVIYGKDKSRMYRGIAADPCKSSATWGFIVTAVQNIHQRLGVVARVDMKDTLNGSISGDSTCQKVKSAAESDRVITYGGGLLYYVSPNLKATITYEHPTEQGANKVDNDFAMAQLQARY